MSRGFFLTSSYSFLSSLEILDVFKVLYLDNFSCCITARYPQNYSNLDIIRKTNLGITTGTYLNKKSLSWENKIILQSYISQL